MSVDGVQQGPVDVEPRVEVELRAGNVHLSLSFVDTPSECIRQIVSEVVSTMMSPGHHRLRELADAQ